MKRLLALLVALVALLILPISAQATFTQTNHLNGQPIDVGPAGCVAGDLIITGNGVLHVTINNALDEWVTGTVEGAATATDGTNTFSGHAVAWFGVEANANNFVTHFIANATGTLNGTTSVSIHQEGQFTVNAQMLPVVNRVTVTCS